MIHLSLFRYAYSWSRETEVKTEPDRDRGGPRPDRDRDRDLDRMVCQKPDRDRDRPTLQGTNCGADASSCGADPIRSGRNADPGEDTTGQYARANRTRGQDAGASDGGGGRP